MKKFILAAVAAASLFAVSAPAFAGYTLCNAYGCSYVPTCTAVLGPYGWYSVCG